MRSIKIHIIIFLITISCLLFFYGCGYHVVDAEHGLPAEIGSIAIPLLENRTIEAGLEDLLTQELRRQFLENRGLEVLPVSEADAVLSGTIHESHTSAVTYSKAGKVNVARVEVSASFRLEHRGGGETIWQSGRISASEDYPAGRDPLNNERMRRLALEQVAEDLSETVREMVLYDF